MGLGTGLSVNTGGGEFSERKTELSKSRDAAGQESRGRKEGRLMLPSRMSVALVLAMTAPP